MRPIAGAARARALLLKKLCLLYLPLGFPRVWGELLMDSFKFFQNKGCRFFPCHKGASAENFNCMFCYCPLYALGRDCGGNFTVLENGVKSCENCLVPHGPDSWDRLMERIPRVTAKVKNEMKAEQCP